MSDPLIEQLRAIVEANGITAKNGKAEQAITQFVPGSMFMSEVDKVLGRPLGSLDDGIIWSKSFRTFDDLLDRAYTLFEVIGKPLGKRTEAIGDALTRSNKGAFKFGKTWSLVASVAFPDLFSKEFQKAGINADASISLQLAYSKGKGGYLELAIGYNAK